MGAIDVLIGNDPVLVTPRRSASASLRRDTQVRVVDSLAAWVDHRPEGPFEYLSVLGLAERCVGQPHLADVRQPLTVFVHRLAHLVSSVANERRKEQGHQVLGTGQREKAAQPADLAPQPAATDKHQPVNQLGILVRDCLASQPPSE
jgi:hypothetical protein